MKNKLIIISGASGSGKSTITNALSNNQIVSFTTREKRDGEQHGVDYLFISKEEFEYLLKNDGLIESTQYGSNFYGITKKELEDKLSVGDAFVIVDVVGMKQLKKIHRNSVSIFIYNNKENVESNMRLRGDKEENIQSRMKTFDEEILNMHLYDHVVINEQGFINEAIEDVRDIIGG